MLKFVLAFVLWPSLAFAQQYLPQPAMTDCQTRSAAQCQALSCDGVHTIYWWACQSLTAADGSGNTAAIVTTPGDPYYDATTPHTSLVKNIGSPGFHVAMVPTGLNAPEQATVVSRAQMGTLLSDIIASAVFSARFTPPQIAAIQLSPLASQWQKLIAGPNVDLTDPALQTFLNAAVAAGIIPAAQIETITAATPTMAQAVATPSLAKP